MTERRSWARLPHIAILLVFAALAPGLSLAAVPPASPAPFAPAADTLVIQGLGKSTAELGGKWQFKTGDDMAWASPSFDDSNAGHLSPFLNDRELELPSALPLGIVPDMAFETMTERLGVGDRLTLYTDGLLEARNLSGELYGFDRVRKLIGTQPDAHAASEAAVAFGQDDDITVLTVTRLAVGVESTTRLVAPELVSSV